MNDFYRSSVQECAEELKTSLESGLIQSEIEDRLEIYGFNEIVEQGVKPAWKILLDQFKETMVIILIIAAVISLFLGEFIDAGAILLIVILNAILGFRQEYKAEQAMEALRQLAVPTVRVRRSGHVKDVSAKSLVPGDIVLLEAGNYVPADCRLFESINLQAQESALTGESEPVLKYTDKLIEEIPLAERSNMVYMGTVITYGRGQGMVVRTGMDTELGSIAELMQEAEPEPTPLQKRLTQLGKGLAVVAFILVGIIFAIGLSRGGDIKELFLTSISIAVAAIPEGLPAVVTIALAFGARRMLERRALIRKLPAVEALGSVTVICSDKTGTLTENRMTVTVLDVADNRIDLSEDELKVPFKDIRTTCFDIEPDPEQQKTLINNPALTLLLAGGALCNDAILECPDDRIDEFQIVGDPTEGALLLAANRMGLNKDKLAVVFPRVSEVPFDSERKRMTTVHKMPVSIDVLPDSYKTIWDWDGWTSNVEYVEFTKGALDGLLEITDQVWVKDHIEGINSEWLERINKANERLARDGMRVLGIACGSLEELPKNVLDQDIENQLILVGLVGMIDPARPEVKDAVQKCKSAGIRPIMITGDHPLTARYIAEELGIGSVRSVDDGVLTGAEIQKMDHDELERSVTTTSVYARVTPEHKLRIVESLQGQGEIAAMTGDGVNDAPALKKADIGIAMGITGTDVSKEASDMVLVDDNFATIVAAIEEGRIIYDNIRKFIQYTLSSNAGEIWIMLFAPFLGMPLPLKPLQILWINLVTDGLPGLALSMEKGERNTMERPPYPPKENIFARGLGVNILWVGFLMAFISLGVGYLYIDTPYWQTMIFTTITLSELGYVLAIRSYRDSLFTIGVLSNKLLIGAILLTFILQMMVIYIPVLQNLFHTTTLPFPELLICLFVSTIIFWAVELQKFFIRKREAKIG